MRIEFEWEKIYESSVGLITTYRSKVFGGWIVLHDKHSSIIPTDGSFQDCIVFIPDKNHEWEL